jgi:HSP20 family protein
MDLEKFGTSDDLRELLAVRDRVEELSQGRRSAETNAPKAEMRDLGDAWRIVMEVPGVSQENLEIALQGRELVIAGIREVEATEGDVIFTERPTGPFHRTLQLPGDVDGAHLRAHLQQGLLVVTLPKD